VLERTLRHRRSDYDSDESVIIRTKIDFSLTQAERLSHSNLPRDIFERMLVNTRIVGWALQRTLAVFR
jgi:hypothetical protein